MLDFSPLEVNCLDDKAQCWTDCGHILVHNLLHNGGFACIIKAPGVLGQPLQRVAVDLPYSIRILISLSFNLAFRRIDSISPGHEGLKQGSKREPSLMFLSLLPRAASHAIAAIALLGRAFVAPPPRPIFLCVVFYLFMYFSLLNKLSSQSHLISE